MIKRIVIGLIVVFVLTGLAAVEQLSLEAAKDLVLEQNLAYKSLQAKGEKSLYSQKSALFSFFPSAQASGRHLRYDPEMQLSGEYSTQLGLSLNQPLLANGSIYYGYKMQKENNKLAELAIKQKRVELLTQLEILYYNVLESEKNLNIAESSLERAEKAFANGQVRFQQATISKDQLLRLEVDVTNKSLNLLTNRSSLSEAYRSLLTYLNSKQNYELVEVDFIENRSLLEQQRLLGANFAIAMYGSQAEGNLLYRQLLEQLTHYLTENSPQLASSEVSLSIAAYSLKQQQASYLPNLNLSLETNWSATKKNSTFNDQTTLMLNASVAIFPLVNKFYNVQTQKMNQRATNYDYHSLQQTLESTLETSLNNYLTALQRTQLAEQTFNLNNEIFQQRTTKYQAGLISVDEYLDAQVELDQAKEQFNSSLYGFLKSESALRRTMGMENNVTLINIFRKVLEEK